MPTENADQAQGSPFSRNFQDAVTLIEYDGKLVVVARQFGQFLGYADEGKQLVKLVIDDWSDEFIELIDYILLKNGRLADFKRICSEMGLKLVDKRAPSLLLLTKSGMELVLARTEKPQGKVFRRWLVSEVIPGYEIARRGEALLGPEASTAALPPPPARALVRRPRERRITGPTAELADLLSRFRQAGVIDPGTYTALRALIERLAGQLAPPPPPPPPPPRALPGPCADALDLQLDRALGPRPPEYPNGARIHYDVGREALRSAADARRRRAQGEVNEDINRARWSGIELWIKWFRAPHMPIAAVDEALTRLEPIVDEMFGTMPAWK